MCALRHRSFPHNTLCAAPEDFDAVDIILEAVIFLDVGVTLSKQLVALIMPSLFRNLVAAIQVIFEIFVCGFISSDFIGVFSLNAPRFFGSRLLYFL